MKKWKRIWSFLLALCLIVTQLPATALAEGSTGVMVGGENLSIGYYKTNSAGNLSAGNESDYNIHLKEENNQYVLTLNNATIYGVDNQNYGAGIFYESGTLPLEIVLINSNKVTARKLDSGNSAAIWISGQSLTISGGGTIVASAKEHGSSNPYASYGIRVAGENCNLTIKGGEIEAHSGAGSTYNYGIYVEQGEICIEENTKKVTVSSTGTAPNESGGGGPSSGICAKNIIITAGEVKSTAGKAVGGKSAGISGKENVVIAGKAKVYACGGESDDASYGLASDGTLAVTGSAIIVAEGGSATKDGTTFSGNGVVGGCSFGIGASDDITINDTAQITAIGGKVTGNYGISHGIGTNANITINGSKMIKAIGANVTISSDNNNGLGYGLSYGIGAVENITINDSADVTATAGNVILGHSYGIGTRGDISFDGKNTVVKATGGSPVAGNSYGIGTTGKVTVNNGTVTGIGGNPGTGYSYGVGSGNEQTDSSNGAETVSLMAVNEAESAKGIIMNGGTINATGGKAVGSVGMCTAGNFEMNGGTVNAIGGEIDASAGTSSPSGNNLGNSYGVGIRATANINGGQINADGGKAIGGNSYGFAADNLNVTGGKIDADAKATTNGHSIGLGAGTANVEGGEIRATGNTATGGNSYGVGTTSDFGMTGGTVNAQGGKATSATASVSLMSISRSSTRNSGYSFGIGSMTNISLGGTGKLTAKSGVGEVAGYGCGAMEDITLTLDDMTLNIYGNTTGFGAVGKYNFQKDGESMDVPTGKSYTYGQSIPNYNGSYYPSYNYYNISASAGEGGTISAIGTSSIIEGQNMSYVFIPDSGYVIADVLVDGVSIGAVSSYTFENVYAQHTIEVRFVKANATETVKLNKNFATLCLKNGEVTENTIELTWKKVADADGYVVYGNKCNSKGKTYKAKKLAVLKDGNIAKWTHRDLEEGTYYKYYIKAYKLVNGKKVFLEKSEVVRVTTGGGKYGNAKSLILNKTSVSLNENDTFAINAQMKKADKKIAVLREIKYESSDKSVVTVSRDGVIRAKGKGNCTVYVYAQNGVYKKIKVTVE